MLTKPIGMGILTTAIKRDLIDLNLTQHCAKIMASLNYIPSKIMKKYRVSSCTDITGFGLLCVTLLSVLVKILVFLSSNEVPFYKRSF